MGTSDQGTSAYRIKCVYASKLLGTSAYRIKCVHASKLLEWKKRLGDGKEVAQSHQSEGLLGFSGAGVAGAVPTTAFLSGRSQVFYQVPSLMYFHASAESPTHDSWLFPVIHLACQT